MKILHISDTHIGFSAYRKTTPDGINQRELDTYDAFKQFVDYALEIKPDLIIHAGDFFDSVRPNNRAITLAINQLIRISKEKIPFVVIAGNHEHPKLKETGHIFSVIDHIEHFYPVYRAKYEKIPLLINNKEVSIHAIPHCELKKQFEAELKKLKSEENAEYNILVCHGAVKGIREFTMNEFNELTIPVKILSKDFDYIALGHYHKYSRLANNAFYSGSTERFTFYDALDKKGFINIELQKKQLKTNFIELKTRPMVDTKPIKCTHLNLEEVMKKIKQTIREIEPEEKTYRVTLDDIPTHIYRGLDFNELRKISSKAIHYEIKANVVKERDSKSSTSSKIDALTNEFIHFLESQELKEKEILIELGTNYIEKIEAREEGK